jgi:hypothetical protein
MNNVLDMYNYRCNNGGYYGKKSIKYNGDLDNLVSHYGFFKTKIIKGDKEIKAYSNNLFCVNGETKEITFEAYIKFMDLEVKDFLWLREIPIEFKEE